MIGIYKITSPTNKVYIGQSVNIKQRWNRYKNMECISQPALYNSFKKHTALKHKFEILEECNVIDLNEKERYYQDLYSVINGNGLNCILTPSKGGRGIMSDETKKKISLAHIGKTISETTRQKLRIANLGNKYAKGNKHTIEALKKISDNSKKQKLRKDHIDLLSKINSLKVINTKNGYIYNSIIECATLNGYNANNLSRYLNGKRKNKTNFIFYENK